MSIRVLDQAEVVKVNDNRGNLFEVVRASDRSVVCDDESLYEDGFRARVDGATRLPPIAIGDVRPTDVLVLTLDRLALQGRVIPTSKALMPAGLSAMWSFAEVLRRGCQVTLDVHTDELQVGLQPTRGSTMFEVSGSSSLTHWRMVPVMRLSSADLRTSRECSLTSAETWQLALVPKHTKSALIRVLTACGATTTGDCMGLWTGALR